MNRLFGRLEGYKKILVVNDTVAPGALQRRLIKSSVVYSVSSWHLLKRLPLSCTPSCVIVNTNDLLTNRMGDFEDMLRVLDKRNFDDLLIDCRQDYRKHPSEFDQVEYKKECLPRLSQLFGSRYGPRNATKWITPLDRYELFNGYPGYVVSHSVRFDPFRSVFAVRAYLALDADYWTTHTIESINFDYPERDVINTERDTWIRINRMIDEIG